MLNSEKFKTPLDRANAFEHFCIEHICDKCQLKVECSHARGQFAWLDLEAEEELLPCPCCGGACVVTSHSEGHNVRCRSRYCYIGKAFESRDDAIANHNRVSRAVAGKKEEK